jgi:RimJ/RimL family protein N-acetyltransferase
MLKLVPLPEFDPALIGYYLNWYNDPEISYRIAPSGGLPKTAAGVLGWMRSSNVNPHERRFTIVLDEDGREEPIGSCALVSINHDLGSAGIIIFIGEENLRGRGLGKMALRVLINYAFEELKLKRLFLGVDVANFRAFNAYIKCGFVEVARQELAVLGAAPRSECLMELKKEEVE